ncbi:hypothetical protein BpHYR1_004803 [Brachionus plicatilis]|uniref:Uncharacterized protein n=1 Tax=Brachionus plicatilis TaxID=10195 RepID=A0A3M7PX95_BRAPC|nr:hypothetical protein BpHYR1_004803 [Brachionus plicatilis]
MALINSKNLKELTSSTILNASSSSNDSTIVGASDRASDEQKSDAPYEMEELRYFYANLTSIYFNYPAIKWEVEGGTVMERGCKASEEFTLLFFASVCIGTNFWQ